MLHVNKPRIIQKFAACAISSLLIIQLLPLGASAATSDIKTTLSADKISIAPGETVTITETLNGTDNLMLIDGSEVNTLTSVIGYDNEVFTPAEEPLTLPENTLTSALDYNKNYDTSYTYYSCYSGNLTGSSRVLTNTSGGSDNKIDMFSWDFTASAAATPGTYRFYLTPTYNSAIDSYDYRTYLNTENIGEFQLISSSYVDITITTPLPGVPANLTANPANGQVLLSWNDVTGATGYTVKYGTTSGALASSLDVTDNTTTVTGLTNGTTYYFAVCAINGGNTGAYSTEVSAVPAEPASNNATLTNLTTSAGDVTPAFNGGTTAYMMSVPSSITNITVTPTAASAGATIQVNGTSVVSGSPSGNISLDSGANEIQIIVTAEDGTTTKTYTITATRNAASADATLKALTTSAGPISPIFASGTTSYTLNVSSGVASMTVTPTLNNGAANVAVNDVNVPSGSASGSISLDEGVNTITIVVTAEDGTTTKTYTLTVTKAASLSITTTLSADHLTIAPGQTVTIMESLNGTNNLMSIDGSEVNTLTTVIGYDNGAFTPADEPVTLPENTLTSALDYNKNYDTSYVYYSCYSGNTSGSSRVLNNASGGDDNKIDMVSWTFTANVTAAPGTYRFYLTPTYNTAIDMYDYRTYLNTENIGEFQLESSSYVDITISDATVPEIPTGFTVTAGDGQVTLDWNDVAGATGYTVKYGTTSGSLTSTQDVTNSTATITALTNGTTYYFAVCAKNGAAVGAYTDEVNATPSASSVNVIFMSNGSVYMTVPVSIGSAVAEPDDPVASGYVFAGWYSDITFESEFDFSIVISGETTLYGKWILKGDINDNGVIDLQDYILAKGSFLGKTMLTPLQIKVGDMDSNASGIIELKDYIMLKAIFLD